MNAAPGRTIVYDDHFQDEADALQPDVRRLDEAIRYLEIVLAVTPEVGLPSGYPGVRIAPLVLPVPGSLVPAEASVFYTYDDERVWLLSIRLAPTAEAE